MGKAPLDVRSAPAEPGRSSIPLSRDLAAVDLDEDEGLIGRLYPDG